MSSSLSRLRDELNNTIQAYNWPDNPAKLYEPLAYIMSLGGKRMRPLASLMACEMFSGDFKAALKPSLAIEFFHNFSLIHDDIMDQASLRRGKATVHEKWDLNVGILSGDALLVKAYQQFEDVEPALFPKLIKKFNQTALEVCEGQQLDMDLAERRQVSIEEYLQMISYKKAVLLAFSFEMGALIGGASTDEANHMYSMGLEAGIGFQIQDDLLDAFADPEKFGKKVGGDIIENKQTYLRILAKEKANSTELQRLEEAFALSEQEGKVEKVIALYQEFGIEELVRQKADSYFQSSLKHLAAIQLPEAQKTSIQQLIEQLWIREY